MKIISFENANKLFYRFLKEKNCYENYQIYIKNQKIIDFDYIYWISGTFIWDKTHEGYIFWENLNYEWSILYATYLIENHFQCNYNIYKHFLVSCKIILNSNKYYNKMHVLKSILQKHIL